jgi:uncharacterized protein
MEGRLPVKNEIRVVGIDDCAFLKGDPTTRIIGVVFRGGQFMDGCMTATVEVDGSDATERIISMLKSSKFLTQLQYVLLDGIAVGGFNVIDIKALAEQTGLGVIVIIRRQPDIETIHKTLTRLGMESKIALLKKAGTIYRHDKIFFQCAGVTERDAKVVITTTATHSFIPEPIRIAHLIGQSLVFGESRGRA